MRAYKVRNDEAYIPAAKPRAQVAAIGEGVDLRHVPSPALALQGELARRLADVDDGRLSPGASLVVILSLGLLGWMPILAAGWMLFT